MATRSADRLMMSAKPPGVKELSKSETLSSFLAWQGNLTYNLSLNPNFAEFLSDDVRWLPRSESNTRGFENAYDHNRKLLATGAQRASFLETMLGMIAGYTPIISRNIIVRDCRSLKDIFHKIRAHFGFAQNGRSIIDAVSITQKEDESPEDVFQRIHSLVDTSLLCAGDGMKHMGSYIRYDEEMSPTLSNLITCLWLKSIHPNLPSLVKQKFATELRNCTIASIREEISSAIPDLLLEVDNAPSGSVFLASSFNRPQNRQFTSNQREPSAGKFNNNRPPNRASFTARRQPSCPICKQAGRRNFNHFLSSCQFLPEEDRRFVSRARLIESLEDENSSGDCFDRFPEDVNQSLQNQPQYGGPEFQHPHSMPPFNTGGTANQVQLQRQPQNICMRVSTSPSPFINAYIKNRSVKITLDTGANIGLVNERLVQGLHLPIKPTAQTALQADGVSSLDIQGETHFTLKRDNISLHFEGLIVRGLECEVLAGIPFMEQNDVAIRPSRNEIAIQGKMVSYDSCRSTAGQGHCKRVYSAPVVCESHVTLFPSDSIDIACNNTQLDGSVFLEPCNNWISPEIVHCVDGRVRVTNSSELPVVIEANQVIANTTTVSDTYMPELASDTSSPIRDQAKHNIAPVTTPVAPGTESNIINKVKFNPQCQSIDSTWKVRFNKLHLEHAAVFGDDLPGYNGKFGPVTAFVNVGESLPPQRRGKIPQYSKNNLVELQQHIDDLEKIGVFATPESVGTYAEYINPTFLVKKPDSDSRRLVTSFGEVAAHSKPTPTLASNIDDVLREFGSWRYIIKTDLKKAYYQIPLHANSRKFCAIVSPFKGVRVYCRAAMGMPGSECALDELMSRMLGDLIQAGDVKRVADDIYVGANDIESLFVIWEKVLRRIENASLRLTPHKTEVLPSETSILGWIWREGKLLPSPHHIAPLSVCEQPKTVKGLRSYLGAYKVVSRCLKHCSQFIAPLETLSAGKNSADIIAWDHDSIAAFKDSQLHLSKCCPINLPSADSKLCLITDASSAKAGIAATLVSVDDTQSDPKICSFFSAKLKGGHAKWLPCEIECLAIASAINHFRPFILNSTHRTTVLTDSKPAVQAYQKFIRGEFSTSSRMQSFLLSATQNNVIISHISGSKNCLADFGSRNSTPCTQPTCSVCHFLEESQSAGVNSVSVQDCINGSVKIPFGSPSAWLQIQLNCPVTQLARKHLQQGTRPMKKLRNVRNVKHLVKIASVDKDGLLIVRKTNPLNWKSSLIVIPDHYTPGIITALHLQLGHPSAYQLQQVFDRQFYAINSTKLIQESVRNCHQCHSIQSMPRTQVPHSTSAPYSSVGSNFAADIIRRNRQMILAMCEEVTKFTVATFLDSEQHSSILKGLKELLYHVHPTCSATATVKVDPAPGMKSLVRTQPLQNINIVLELGEAKNKNKLATIDKQIQELENEFVRIEGTGSKLDKENLSCALSALNSRIRSCGLSSYEQWHRRNQYDKSDIPISDRDLISLQGHNRDTANSRNRPTTSNQVFMIGNIVYLSSEKTKLNARPRYIVDKIEGEWLHLRKLTDNQLRATTYKVHRNACTTIPERRLNLQTRVHPESDSETDFVSEVDDIISEPVPTSPITTPATPPIPPTVSESLTIDNASNQHAPVPTASHPISPPEPEEFPSSGILDDEWVPAHPSSRMETLSRSDRPSRTRKPPERYGNPLLY